MGETNFQLFLVGGIVLAIASLAAAALQRAPRTLLLAATALVGIAAAAAWIAFALRPTESLAIAAAGLTLCVAAELGAWLLAAATERWRQVEAEIERAEARLRAVVEQEAAAQAAELDRALARARAESLSKLSDEERRIADERRRAVVEQEDRASSDLQDALAASQQRVEQRLAAWAQDLERVHQSLAAQLQTLAQRQQQLIAAAETRLETEAQRIEATSDEQRAAVVRLRQELDRTVDESAAAAHGELEVHATERRRALHQLGERLRNRERELREQIEREEAEAVRRIETTFADVERRQVEQLERAMTRATASFSEAAAQEFSDALRRAREDTAQRLGRELDRAVASFAHEGERVLAERLAQVGDAGAQRLERRFSQVTAGLERQRDELVAGFEQRLADAEAELRRRVQGLIADIQTDRAALETRLGDLARRIDEQARERVGQTAGGG